MSLMRDIGKLAFSSFCWILLFLACRVLAWGIRWPAWWTLPLALSIGLAWVGLSRMRDILREIREERDAALGAPVDPRLAARMRLAWKQGRRQRRNSLFQPSPPWFLCLEQAPTRCGGLLDNPDAGDDDSGDGEEFSWQRGPHALWLDYPDAVGEDQGRWHAFVQQLSGRQAPLAGIAVAVEADCLVLEDVARLRGRARLLRRRIEGLTAGRENLPVYVVVNRLDCLYGMRSLVDGLGSPRLRRPLGAVRRKAETPDAFARRVVAVAGNELTRLPSGSAAALQAPAELERLEQPLAEFCAHLFGGGHACLRGMYLASSAPGGGTIPPLMVRMGTFKEINEEPPRGGSWFLRNLLREGIPGDVELARRATAPRGARAFFPAGATGVLAGTLVLCWLLTWSFLSNRNILLSARGLARPPASAEMLEPYFELASQTHLQALGWRLPRFGMREAEDLAEELRRRYTDSYFDLKTVPAIDSIQEAALAAGKSSDPVLIGNTLLLLAVTREGIARNLEGNGEPDETARFLHRLVDDLRLASPADMRLLEAYFAWAGRQDWMPETCAALAEFEKYVVANAGGGNLSWLLSWVETVPGVKPVDVSRVWDPVLVAPRHIGGVWTAGAYGIVDGMLRAMAHGADDSELRQKRENILAEYRHRAVEKWREAADQLWVGFRKRLKDAELPELISAAERLDDPAMRFVDLLREHLLPMFADDPNHPDAKWVLLYGGMQGKGYDIPESQTGVSGEFAGRIARALRDLGSDAKLDELSGKGATASESENNVLREKWKHFAGNMRAAASDAGLSEKNLDSIRANYQKSAGEGYGETLSEDPLYNAGIHANALHAMLREASGSDAWEGVSPLASFDYLRCLASRFAALSLDRQWRHNIYLRTRLLAGTEAEKLKRVRAEGMLEKFFSKEAAGLWRWDDEKCFANGEWDGLEFWFSPRFLDFYRKALDGNAPAPYGEIPLTFRIDAVNVDPGALERPIGVEFILRGKGDAERKVVFENYGLVKDLTWSPGPESGAVLKIRFNALTAEREFSGKALREFFEMFTGDLAVIGVEAFPAQEASLRRLGITRISMRARVENADKVLALYKDDVIGLMPETIIVPCGEPYEPPAVRRPVFAGE